MTTTDRIPPHTQEELSALGREIQQALQAHDTAKRAREVKESRGAFLLALLILIVPALAIAAC